MTFLRVMAFSIAVILCYTLFANILPQVQSDPPSQEKAPTGKLDKAELVAYGEELFSGQGTCTLCHNDLGRAPNLLKLDLAKTFASRLSDPRYSGRAKVAKGAKAVELYVRESLFEPSAYVVSGFGKKGTNDKVSPMPKFNAPPIKLEETQIVALIAFLQSRAGLEPSVSAPGEAKVAAKADKSADAAPKKKKKRRRRKRDRPAKTAVAALGKFGCVACHDLEGSKADAGPKLHGIADRMSREKIIESILKPNAEISKGFKPDMMPPDFDSQMRVSELNLVVDYLLKLKN